MAKKQLSEYSDKELSSQLAKAKVIFAIFIGLIVTMIFVSVLTTYLDKITFNTFLPLFFIPMLFISYNQVKALKKELTSRK